jgi:signal transduction histidine kinase
VRNEGIRLRAAEVERARERGWRSEEAASTTGEGSGIGLWIVDQIMKALGGELRISPTSADDLTDVRMLFPTSSK